MGVCLRRFLYKYECREGHLFVRVGLGYDGLLWGVVLFRSYVRLVVWCL